MSTIPAAMQRRLGRAGGNDMSDRVTRLAAWLNLAVLGAFIVNVTLVYSFDWPGFEGGGVDALVMGAIYAVALVGTAIWVLRSPMRCLREDADDISDFNKWLIRGAFFAVLLVGLADAAISFLRIERMLPALVGDDISSALGRAAWRGANVHVPLIFLGFVIALFARTLGFTWLALMVVSAELCNVIFGFVFSYQQAFMSDLVRFWYAALFLFASAYTLLDEGHVRVDVFYAGMTSRGKAKVNTVGTLVCGIALMWVVLWYGFAGSASAMVGPMIRYEATQAALGLQVKWLMAGFLAMFAVSMLIQFSSYLLDAVADLKGDPGGRSHDSAHVG